MIVVFIRNMFSRLIVFVIGVDFLYGEESLLMLGDGGGGGRVLKGGVLCRTKAFEMAIAIDSLEPKSLL